MALERCPGTVRSRIGSRESVAQWMLRRRSDRAADCESVHVCGARPIGTVSTGGARAPPQHLLPSSAREEVPEGIGEQNVLRRESHVLVALRHVRTLAAGWATQFSERETVNWPRTASFQIADFRRHTPRRVCREASQVFRMPGMHEGSLHPTCEVEQITTSPRHRRGGCRPSA